MRYGAAVSLVASVRLRAIAAAAVFAGLALAQSQTMTEGAHRMEIVLERLNGDDWRAVDPTLVLAQGDRVRFKFRTNFDGFLYVMNQSTSGKYEQLFPRIETGEQNNVAANQQYQVPATSTAFRIVGPAGYEVVYWLVTPGRLTDAPPRFGAPPPDLTLKPPTLIPRCDDSVMRARGDCVARMTGEFRFRRVRSLSATRARKLSSRSDFQNSSMTNSSRRPSISPST